MILPLCMLTDDDFSELFPNKEDSVIEEMIDSGWTLGKAIDGQNEFWPPEDL